MTKTGPLAVYVPFLRLDGPMLSLLAFLVLAEPPAAPPRLPAGTGIRPKVLVLYDMEGISGIVSYRQILFPKPEYQTARGYLTGDVNAAIEGLIAGGAGEIVVTDAHGSGNATEPDVLLNRLDRRATFLWKDHAFDPYLEAMDSSFQAIVCVGMHARAGTDGFLAHTVTFEPAYRVNGRWLGETSIVARSAARFGVPVIMVSGDNVLQGQIAEEFPDIEYALVKTAKGPTRAEPLSFATAREHIRTAAKTAIEKLPGIKPLPVEPAYRFEVSYRNALEADLAAGAAKADRVDSLTLAYTAPDFVSGFEQSTRMTRAAWLERLRLLAQVALASPGAAKIRAEYLDLLLTEWLEPGRAAKRAAAAPSAAKKRFHGDG